MGGINAVAKPRADPVLSDPWNSTIVMGAHRFGPTPTDGRCGPSFTGLVTSVDSETAKYIADCGVQTSHREIIEDLEAMATAHIALYKIYQRAVEKRSSDSDPQRVIFYRSGVSEGQFKNVLEFGAPLHELPLLHPWLIECAVCRNY